MLKKCLFIILSAYLMSGCGGKEECGNGTLDVNEQCDGFDFGSLTCYNINKEPSEYIGGQLGCSNSCKIDISSCNPCWKYPCGPYGTSVGDTIENYEFSPGNPLSRNIAGADGIFKLEDLYRLSEARELNLKLLVIFASTGWCPYCKFEANILDLIYLKYKDQGVMLLGVIAQDEIGNPATPTYAEQYGNNYGWSFPSVAGFLEYSLWPDSNSIAYPFHLIVDLNSMTILDQDVGTKDFYQLEAIVNGVLDKKK